MKLLILLLVVAVPALCHGQIYEESPPSDTLIETQSDTIVLRNRVGHQMAGVVHADINRLAGDGEVDVRILGSAKKRPDAAIATDWFAVDNTASGAADAVQVPVAVSDTSALRYMAILDHTGASDTTIVNLTWLFKRY